MTATSYTRIGTCAAIGENLAVRLPEIAGIVSVPCLSSKDLELHVGLGATWNQRRAFEWGLLGGVFRRSGDVGMADYCSSRVAQLIATEFDAAS